MQKIRRTIYSPLTGTGFVVVTGLVIFLLGTVLLLVGTTKVEMDAARFSFRLAGWVLTAGWLLKRIKDRQWPFPSRYAGNSRHFELAKRFFTNVLVISGAVLGAVVWRTYGPVVRDFIPRSYTTSSHSPVYVPRTSQAATVLSAEGADRNVLPVAYHPLSLSEYGALQQVFSTTPRGLPNEGLSATDTVFPFSRVPLQSSQLAHFDSATRNATP